MKALQLVTTPRPFFRQQVDALEARGVDCTTLAVPGVEHARRPVDFGRFYGRVLDRSLRGEFDIVHANYGLTIPFALAQPVRPVVSTLWGSEVMSDVDWLVSLTERTAPHCDAVITPSEPLSDRYPGDDVVVPFGVDTNRFHPIPQPRARDRVGWPASDRIVLFPYDTDRPVKNFQLAKDVVADVDGPVQLRTVSGVDHAEMPYYYNASDAVLVTSRRESGPMVLKEAVACGVPVVSTDVGFAADVLADVDHSAVRTTQTGLAEALEPALETDSDAAGVADGGAHSTADSMARLGADLEAVYTDCLQGAVDG